MKWSDIAGDLGLDSRQMQVFAAQLPTDASETEREAAQTLSRESLGTLGFPFDIDPDVPLTIVTASVDHGGAHGGAGAIEPHDLYFAIQHGPKGSKGPITLMKCHGHKVGPGAPPSR